MTMDHHDPRRTPLDQADGLRRLFAASRARFVALVANPRVPIDGVLIERLGTALAALGRRVLVVDAAETSPPVPELAWIDLAACIEPLSPALAYLPARGLPARHVDTRGCSGALLDALAAAAPQADAIVLHAGASDLGRLFMRRALRPVLMAADSPASVTEAYAGLKLLALRQGWLSFDLLLAAAPDSPRRARIARQLADCADRFVGAALHDWAAVDPAADAGEPPDAGLLRLAGALLETGQDSAVGRPPMLGAGVPAVPAAFCAPAWH
jgi:flagellar biosynthesis protein FlhG